jgi:hypothetical protein
MSFKPLDDLSDQNDVQREEYYQAACAFLGVPPELKLLRYFYTGDAPNRKLILYATRGATDLIRENKKISTVSLTQHDGPGYVSFTATGKDPAGRLEMATGVASTEGLKGETLVVAITVAQTKATRRMTLQFAGGGFLDETELPGNSGSPASEIPSGVALAQLLTPPPSVAPNSAPGTDVTEETQEQFEVRQAKLRADAQAALMAGLPKLSPNPPKEGDSLQTVAEPVAEAEAEAKPKRTRRPRNTVSLDSPGQAPAPVPAPVQTVIPPGNIDANGVITPVPTQAIAVAPIQTDPAPVTPASIQIPSATPIEPQPIKVDKPAPQPIQVDTPVDAPSAEQLKEYRVRLAKFANEVLPSGNMIPIEGVGGVTMQLRKFAGLQLGETKDVSKFSTAQWQELLDFLDQYLAANGAVGLVKYIHKSLGIV